jgi:hypothetical protein
LYEEYPPYFREYLRRYEEDPTSRVFASLAEAYRKLGRLYDAISICRKFSTILNFTAAESGGMNQ